MMPITRKDLQILLDTPDEKDYIVTAYADLSVKDGWFRYVEVEMKNLARAVNVALSEAEARTVLEASLDPIRRAIETADPTSKGLAAFSGAKRGLFHSVALDFPVSNKIILDEDPYVLPLLERWYGDPTYLIAVMDAHQAQLFEARSGVPSAVTSMEKNIESNVVRDKPRFTYKKRFSKAMHETQQKLDNDNFYKDVARTVEQAWNEGEFAGLILLGQSQNTAVLRRLLHKDVAAAVVEEHSQTMTDKPGDVGDDVTRAMDRWQEVQHQRMMEELRGRWDRKHLVANGPTEVLDALQQGRATAVVFGPRRDMAGARCLECGYRFGAPTVECVYCGGKTQSVNAAQEILRMAYRQPIAEVHLLGFVGTADPLEKANGVSALLRAEANWAPNAEAAQA
ncbi:hypothetical protein BH23PLA1_BH23PLA1_30720 [soil metagenome]